MLSSKSILVYFSKKNCPVFCTLKYTKYRFTLGLRLLQELSLSIHVLFACSPEYSFCVSMSMLHFYERMKDEDEVPG